MKITARKLHLYLGLSATLILSAIAISGCILSSKVIIEDFNISSQTIHNENLHQLLNRIEGKFEAIDSIKKTTANAFIIKHWLNGKVHNSHLNIQSGNIISEVELTPFYNWIQNFHRSLLMEKTGKVIVALSAFVLLVLSISGMLLYLRKQGGWHKLIHAINIEFTLANLHSLIGFFCFLPLVIISLSGLYLSLITFAWVPNSSSQKIIYPESPIELNTVSPTTLDSFKNIRLDNFKEIMYPIPEDWFDVYAIKNNQDIQFFDQFTGERLNKQRYEPAVRWSLFVLDLHSGTINPLLAIVFGISSLSIPFFGLSGFLLWRKKRKTLNFQEFSNDNAEVVILVGSETNTTWHFSHSLGKALSNVGFSVYIAAMNELRDFPNAKYLFVMSATYGNGDAPQNANKFLSKVATLSKNNHWQYSILGFGDSNFEKFCHFPQQVMKSLNASFHSFIPFETINKQSPISFKKWSVSVSQALDKALQFDEVLISSKTTKFKVLEKTYFNNKQTSVVRLLLQSSAHTTFNSGDLLAIRPNKETHERFYSIAKKSTDQLALFISIKRTGLGADYLNSLNQNNVFNARVIENKHFNTPIGNTPLLLIGAGTGVAPFVGMIKQNKTKRPIDLFWGCQHPHCDFVIGEHITDWKKNNQLQQCHVTFSKGQKKEYVQDALLTQEAAVIKRIQSRAVIMICGSQAMYESVYSILDKMLTQHGLDSLAILKQQNRFYCEVY